MTASGCCVGEFVGVSIVEGLAVVIVKKGAGDIVARGLGAMVVKIPVVGPAVTRIDAEGAGVPTPSASAQQRARWLPETSEHTTLPSKLAAQKPP